MLDPLFELGRRLRYLLTRCRADAALQQEMAAHRELLGDDPRFGNISRLREDAHDQWGFRWWDDTMRDIALAIRGLRRTPGYAVVAGGTLTLALAVTAAMAAIVNAYFLRPLPYRAADRLYHVMYAPPGPWEPDGVANLDWTSLADVVEFPIAVGGETLFFPGPPQQPNAHLLGVSLGYVEGLGVPTTEGRPLVAADFDGAAIPPAVVSPRFAREHLGGGSAIGQQFRAQVNSPGSSPPIFRVVGVLPQGYWFGSDSRDWVDVLTPLPARARAYRVVLRRGISPAVAAARLTAAVRLVSMDIPPNWPGVTLESARDRYLAPVRPVLKSMTIASVIVLAIACANLAVLALLRALRRQKEIAVRLALGAGRARVMRMLVVEAGVLVAAATLAGLLVASAALGALTPVVSEQLGRPAPGGLNVLAIDATVVLIVALVGVAATAALPPLALLTPWGAQVAAALRRDGRTSTDSRAARRGRAVLVIAEIAGSLALLAGSALMVQSLRHIVGAEYGIRTARIVRATVDFPRRGDDAPATLAALYDDLTSRVEAQTHAPVALVEWPQFAESPKQPVETDAAGRGALSIGVLPVNAAYFDRLGIRVVQGRTIADADRLGAAPVVVVSETAARQLWPGESPIGRSLLVADRFIAGDRTRGWRTVIGVVSDVRQTYDDSETADVYVPFLEAPPARYAWLLLTADGPSASLDASLKQALTSVDPMATLRLGVSLDTEAARQWATPRFLAGLVTAFAVMALLFAALGMYGVTAFSLQQRRREVAIRMALGADRRMVMKLLLREWTAIVAVGLAGGLMAAWATGRALAIHLFGVAPGDVSTMAVAAAIVAGVTLATAGPPAWRAARDNPAAVLGES